MNLRSLARLLLEWLLGFLGILGALLCLSTSFSITLPEGGYFPFLGALLLVFCSLFRLRRGELISVGVLVLLAVIAFLSRRELARSFVKLWDLLADYFARGYDYDFLQGREADRADSVWPALVFIGIFEVYFTAVSISVWKRTLPCAMALMICVIPCFILIDTPPALLPLLMVVFSLTAQALSQSARRREDGEEVRSMLWSSGLAALILGILLAAVPQDSYRPPITLDDITDRFSKASEAFDNRGNIAAGLSGNPSSVDLRQLRRLPTREAVMMQVRSTYTGLVYLRGSSYDSFNGSTWKRSELSSRDELGILYPGLSPLFRYNDAEALTIEPIMEEDLCFTPYDVVSMPDDAVLKGDAWFYNPDGGTTYTVGFITSPAPGRGTADYENRLRNYYDYLYLPDKTRAGLLKWWDSRTAWITDPGADLPGVADVLAAEVAARVKAVCPYSRNPDSPPEDEDFCTWFVNDADSGYCVHFATVAAAMLRALDVPARYVTGYVCHARAGGTVEVTNLHAHAWVEYYANGRWNLLEATPNTATEFGGMLEGRHEATDPSDTEPPDTEPPTTAPPTEPTEPPTTEPPTEPPSQPDTEPTEPSAETESENEARAVPGEAGKGGGFRLRPWMWVFPGILLLILALLLRRRICAALREKKFRGAGTNEGALMLYRRYRRLCGLCGEEPRSEAERLALKAAFSHHELTGEETVFLRQCLDRQTAVLSSAPFFRRLYYRYILAVI